MWEIPYKVEFDMKMAVGDAILCQPFPFKPSDNASRMTAWPIIVPSPGSELGYEVCFTYDGAFRDAYLAKGICGLDEPLWSQFNHSCNPGFPSRFLGVLLGEQGIIMAFGAMIFVSVMALFLLALLGAVRGPPDATENTGQNIPNKANTALTPEEKAELEDFTRRIREARSSRKPSNDDGVVASPAKDDKQPPRETLLTPTTSDTSSDVGV